MRMIKKYLPLAGEFEESVFTPFVTEEFNKLFNSKWLDSYSFTNLPGDVIEEDTKYLCRLPLAGMEKDQINISIENGVINITAENKIEYDSKAKIVCQKCKCGYNYAFTLPDDVDCEKIECELKNGILSVSLPKFEKTQPRKIEIK